MNVKSVRHGNEQLGENNKYIKINLFFQRYTIQYVHGWNLKLGSQIEPVSMWENKKSLVSDGMSLKFL